MEKERINPKSDSPGLREKKRKLSHAIHGWNSAWKQKTIIGSFKKHITGNAFLYTSLEAMNGLLIVRSLAAAALSREGGAHGTVTLTHTHTHTH